MELLLESVQGPAEVSVVAGTSPGLLGMGHSSSSMGMGEFFCFGAPGYLLVLLSLLRRTLLAPWLC